MAGAYIFCALMSCCGRPDPDRVPQHCFPDPGRGLLHELAGCGLIGGNAIEGGRGGVWGVVLGSFFMMLLMAILTMLGISQVGKLIIQGASY